MKKWLLAAMMLSTASLSAQDAHHHDVNPNISPFRTANQYWSGKSKAAFYQQPAWKQFQQKYPDWGASMDPYTGLPHRAFGQPIFISAGGNDPVQKAKAFLQTELAAFNLPLNEFVVTRSLNDGKYIHVDFKQFHNNMEVLWSRTTVRMTQDLRICLFGSEAHRDIPVVQAAITAQQATQAAVNAVQSPVTGTEVEPALKWFPLPENGKYSYRPVYTVTVHTQDDKETPGKYLTYVDAVNSEILYRQNKVVHVGFDVKADLYPTNLFSPLANLPLKNLLVNVNGTNYYTDLLGNVVVPGSGPLNATITLSGKFIKVVTGQNGTVSATYNATNINNGDVVNFPHSNPDATERHMTCYYHANEIHDFMKSHLPAFTAMDNPLTARVDRTDNTCNAFYNGTSINFYTTAGGCNALSLISDVMYHEYGHGITNVFWDDQGSSFDNGGMGEGYSDVWAMCITKSPLIGPGFFVNQPNSTIRRYDINPKVYPQNITGEVHDDGEIIAGAWWDFAQDLAVLNSISPSVAIDTMARIFSDSHYGLATGPDGQEGQVYHDILIDALQYDDDDNNLTNGTPHFAAIVSGFAKHGIYLLMDAELNHAPPGVVNSGSTISIQGDAIADFPVFLGDVIMIYRERGTTALDTLNLTKSGTVYTGTFPNNAGPKVYEYYFGLYDNAGTLAAFSPLDSRFSLSSTQRNLPHFLIIGYKQAKLQDFEGTLSSDWTIGNVAGDNATGGKWIVAQPISSTTSGDTVQTGRDHTSGSGKCAVTGNAPSASSSVGNADVDGGRTTIITEEIDLAPYTEPIISYWRWYSNSQGSNPAKDQWRVFGSYNNGSSWFQIERTYKPDVSWRRNIFLPNLTQGTKMRFMFVATDSAQNGGGGALVEAAIDDIEILEVGNTPAGLSGFNEIDALVYPNPTRDELRMALPVSGLVSLQFRNTIGQVVHTEEYTATAGKVHALNVANWTPGVYFLTLNCQGKRSVQRIVISR